MENRPNNQSRRKFLGFSAVTVASALVDTPSKALADASPAANSTKSPSGCDEKLTLPPELHEVTYGLPDLSPARWIWYPSQRTLPNTFVLFRRNLELAAKPVKATGWIVADSRYKLQVNGKRIQWGPAPCDPRTTEADPVDLTDVLQTGSNVLGATVLHYGFGDGTSPIGLPGFLFRLEIEELSGGRQLIVSDDSWQAHLCRARQPGRYKRWYTRALQESFDARLYPVGWYTADYTPDSSWRNAMMIEGSPNQPMVCAKYPDYLNCTEGGPKWAHLRARPIPLLNEPMIPVKALAESLWLSWIYPPAEYFENRAPDCFAVDRSPAAVEDNGSWKVQLDGSRAAVLTFELAEQVVGFPYFSIEAPLGTAVDLMTQEGHQVGGPALLYTTTNYSWTQFICRAGNNSFECFDYESLRWLQLHIQGRGPVTVHSIGVRRRLFPWRNEAFIRTSDPKLQSAWNATVNTLKNSAIDQFVDGNGRERQQYSGDASNQIPITTLTFGDGRLSARFLNTWSQSLTKDGYFLDNWPTFDRLERISQREMDLTQFGPNIDGITNFGFTMWDHYQITGELELLKEPYRRYLRFANYLIGLINRDEDELIPVTNLGIPFVWLDWDAYPFDPAGIHQRRKQCAFNLYVAGMFDSTLAPLCREFSDEQQAKMLERVAKTLVDATVKRFWDPHKKIFIDNLPWLKEDGSEISMSDRSLAHAILFDQCPGGASGESIRVLAEIPRGLNISYPCNAIWRLRALCKGNRVDVALHEIRTRWADQVSVSLNNTLQEFWATRPDSDDQWSHSAAGPLAVIHAGIVGIRPLLPGFRRAEMQPQLADLGEFECKTFTGRGPVHLKTAGSKGARQVSITIPEGCTCDLLLHVDEKVELKKLTKAAPAGYRRYRLPSGQPVILNLEYT